MLYYLLFLHFANECISGLVHKFHVAELNNAEVPSKCKLYKYYRVSKEAVHRILQIKVGYFLIPHSTNLCK